MLNRFVLTLFFFAIITMSFFVPTVMATDAQLVGKVADSFGTPVAGSKIVISSSTTQKVVDNFPTDISGNYVLHVPQGVYDITVIPPAGSSLAQTTQSHVNVSGNVVKDISLSSSSKLPAQTKKGNSLLSNIIFVEIALVVIALLSSVIWRYKRR
jgi:hypothetical protein